MPEVAPVMSTTLPSNLRRGELHATEVSGACERVVQATRDPAKTAAVIPTATSGPPCILFLERIALALDSYIRSRIFVGSWSAFECMLCIAGDSP
jgi:hypothetical protein